MQLPGTVEVELGWRAAAGRLRELAGAGSSVDTAHAIDRDILDEHVLERDLGLGLELGVGFCGRPGGPGRWPGPAAALAGALVSALVSVAASAVAICPLITLSPHAEMPGDSFRHAVTNSSDDNVT